MRISVDAYYAMTEAGILDPDQRTELLDGVIVLMTSKMTPHMIWQRELTVWLARNLPEPFDLWPEPTFTLFEFSAPQPDLLITRRTQDPRALRGPDAVLLIEVADSTLSKDLGAKKRLYAEAGVPIYWVVDAQKDEVHVFVEPKGGDYASTEVYRAPQEIPLPFGDGLALPLSALKV